MTDNDKPLFPEKADEGQVDDLSSAVSAHIRDDIDDAQSLRQWRTTLARCMVGLAGLFYLALIVTIGAIIFCDSVACRILYAPTVAITIVIVLAAVPTLMLVSVARAVFGKRNPNDSPYSPLQAIIHLMKEMKGN